MLKQFAALPLKKRKRFCWSMSVWSGAWMWHHAHWLDLVMMVKNCQNLKSGWLVCGSVPSRNIYIFFFIIGSNYKTFETCSPPNLWFFSSFLYVWPPLTLSKFILKIWVFARITLSGIYRRLFWKVAGSSQCAMEEVGPRKVDHTVHWFTSRPQALTTLLEKLLTQHTILSQM